LRDFCDVFIAVRAPMEQSVGARSFYQDVDERGTHTVPPLHNVERGTGGEDHDAKGEGAAPTGTTPLIAR